MSGEDRPIQAGVPIVTLEVARDGRTGGLQLSINTLDGEGRGGGYRLAGPKFTGASRAVLVATLDQGGADAIRQHLDDAFPIRHVGGEAEQPLGADVRAQRQAVLALHRENLGGVLGPICNHCCDLDGQPLLWPCPTARALGVPNGSSAAAVTGEATGGDE